MNFDHDPNFKGYLPIILPEYMGNKIMSTTFVFHYLVKIFTSKRRGLM